MRSKSLFCFFAMKIYANPWQSLLDYASLIHLHKIKTRTPTKACTNASAAARIRHVHPHPAFSKLNNAPFALSPQQIKKRKGSSGVDGIYIDPNIARRIKSSSHLHFSITHWHRRDITIFSLFAENTPTDCIRELPEHASNIFFLCISSFHNWPWGFF